MKDKPAEKPVEPSRFWRLMSLRTEIAMHNPDSDKVETLDWAINVIKATSGAMGSLKNLEELISEK